MRILVIEDNPKTNSYISTRLKSENFAVDSTFDGKEGLQLARLHPYDLILLDVDIPLLSGKDILSLLQKEKIQPPIIIISAQISSSTITSFLSLGADDVIAKPFIFEELIARIHAILRRQQPPHLKPLIYKNCKLDYATSCLFISNISISLTRNEFACIEILLKNAPHTVSRKEIFNYVWDTDENYLSNKVETHILNIRKKLLVHNRDILRTKSGKGYFIST